MSNADGPRIFNDPDWKKLRAPVIPPTWVTEKVRRTTRPTYWENGQDEYLMLYYTELENDDIVTRLRPGSVQPVDEKWLY